jgi:hypothetical protein
MKPLVAHMMGCLLLGLWAGCRPTPSVPPRALEPPPSAEEDRSAVESRGREIVRQAGRALSSVLVQAIEQGGYTNAFPLCSVQALPLTESLAQAHGVQLRRVSHRPRNEANRASPQEAFIIGRYADLLEQGVQPEPEVVLSGTGPALFYAPIVIGTNLCLECHGMPEIDLRPEVRPLIAQLYPRDEATGFKLGELRGLWRVDFPRGPQPAMSDPGQPGRPGEP